MALKGQREKAWNAAGHKEYTRLCGSVAIGATGAVTDTDTPGVTVARSSEGIYTFTIDRQSGGANIRHASAAMMFATDIPATAADSMEVRFVSINRTTAVLTAHCFRYKNNSSPAELLEHALQEPESGSELHYDITVAYSGQPIPD